MTVEATSTRGAETLDRVVIRFAGDSGDGMQLVGDRFTELSAVFGNDLATLPNFPAEIRAPAGTIAGVSSFQVHISDHDIVTPGDAPNVLVAMNPAALKANITDVHAGSTLLINVDTFDTRNLDKAGYAQNPLRDESLGAFRVFEIPMTSLTVEATKPLGVKPRDAERSKNFFALGLICWMYTRPTEPLFDWIKTRFGNRPEVLEANLAAFRAGYNFGETAELFDHAYEIKPAKLPAGEYRQITGNLALSYGLVAAAEKAKLPLFYASYPITPASDILHELSKLKNFGVKTLQAEDEISAAGIAIGAAFAGNLAVTGTSGPGVDLKSEALGLAVSLELPMLLVDVQRGGPSTGLPTKTEQADLLLAMYGRHGEAPLPIVAAQSPSDCFDTVFEAARLAIKFRTPVIILTDGYLANGAEPWALPDVDALPDISVPFATEPNHGDDYWPYLRDPETLARPWAIPGTPGLMHRIGGIEKEDGTGNISYEPENHDWMTRLRAEKIARHRERHPRGRRRRSRRRRARGVLVGWHMGRGDRGRAARAGAGKPIAHVHLRHLNPFPRNLGDVLHSYRTVFVPELNMGQLAHLLRAEYLVDTKSYTRIAGIPLRAADLEDSILGLMER